MATTASKSQGKKKASDPTPAQLTGHGASDFDAAKWERDNVHDVYSSIADHFSATRYKPWPLVSSFLATLPPGSIGVDVGCGNGKYLHLRNALHPHPPTAATGGGAGDEEGQSNTNDCLTIGLDRSLELASFAQLQSLERMNGGGTSASASSSSSSPPPAAQWINEVTYGDGLSTCFRSHSFDYAISIATVHHFATRERRREAIREVVRVVRPIKEGERHKGRGRFLIYVWALEQRGQERRKWDEEEGEGEGEGERRRAAADGDGEGEKKAQGRDVMVPWVLKNGSGAKKGGGAEEPPLEGNVFQRYYHLFEATELEALVEEAANDMPGVVVRREDSGWERGNWWGIWQCVAREDAAAAAAAAAVTL